MTTYSVPSRPVLGDVLYEISVEHNPNSEYEWVEKVFCWAKFLSDAEVFYRRYLKENGWKEGPPRNWEASDGWNVLRIEEIREFTSVHVINGRSAYLDIRKEVL